MIDHTKLSGLYTELGQVMAQAASFERQLQSEFQNNYGTLANIHRTLSETMLRIRHLKEQISELESPEDPLVNITPVDPNKQAEITKISPVVGIGYDKSKRRWRFRRLIDGKRVTIRTAPTHAEIVALKQEWLEGQA